MRAVIAALITFSLLIAAPAGAADIDDAVKARLADRLAQIDPRLNIETVAPSGLPGLYEVVLDSGEVLYVDESAEYMLAGQLYRLAGEQGLVNLTEQRLQGVRVQALAEVPAEERVIFPATGETKARIQVFTDVDCAYCRKLHDEVAELNRMGVQVDYLAFPRGGERSAAAAKMTAIWCAEGEQRRELMTRAKQGAGLQAADCDNPVLEQFALGQRLGVNGTPALVLDDGRMLPGSLPADRLAQILGL